MFDRFECGRKDCQEGTGFCVCDWCLCEIYDPSELFLTDCFGWVCEDCFDDWQKINKKKAGFSWKE